MDLTRILYIDKNTFENENIKNIPLYENEDCLYDTKLIPNFPASDFMIFTKDGKLLIIQVTTQDIISSKLTSFKDVAFKDVPFNENGMIYFISLFYLFYLFIYLF